MESEPPRFAGFEAAVLGVACVWHPDGERVERVVYSGPKIRDILIADGMSDEEAVEWIEFNTEGAYVGPQTPIVVWPEET